MYNGNLFTKTWEHILTYLKKQNTLLFLNFCIKSNLFGEASRTNIPKCKLNDKYGVANRFHPNNLSQIQILYIYIYNTL